MTYALPDATALKARFPAFASVDDDVVTQALAEAKGGVAQGWNSQTDYSLGAMLLAAHTMTLDGLGTSPEATFAANGTLGFQSVSDGGMSVSRSAGSTDVNNNLAATDFGRRYIQVRRRNVTGITVVTG